MSETNETKGRCRREMTVAYGARGFRPNDSDEVIADALDRLAADVAAVKKKTDGISPEDVRHFVESEKAWVALVEQDRDRMKDERNKAIAERDAAIRERDEARDEVERLDGEVRDRDARIDELIAGQTTAIRERDEVRAEAERLKAELTARPTAGWLTEVERRILAAHVKSLREQRASLERAGQTHGYTASPGALKHEADIIDALLARAGSPPVVEVAVMVFGSGSYEMQKRYRAALDKAGISWKEAPRE